MNLHDAELYSLQHYSETKVMECKFRSADGRDIILLLGGLKKFRCCDFGLQNVVFDLVSTAAEKVHLEDLRASITWLFSTSDEGAMARGDEIERIVQEVVAGRLVCVFLNPSWGAQFCAITSTVEWK